MWRTQERRWDWDDERKKGPGKNRREGEDDRIKQRGTHKGKR